MEDTDGHMMVMTLVVKSRRRKIGFNSERLRTELVVDEDKDVVAENTLAKIEEVNKNFRSPGLADGTSKEVDVDVVVEDDVRDVMILVLVLGLVLVLVLVSGEGLLDLRDQEDWQGWMFIDEGAIALF